MSISTWAATTGDWDDAKFSRAWNGPYINPAVGSLALTGHAPSDSTNFNIAVGNASLELVQTYDWENVTGTCPVRVKAPEGTYNAGLTGFSAERVNLCYKK